ncbi:hypothetical protein L910_2855 [Vibrio fluvialis PG41]|uniref:Uncharacterized protein n=1 Tax=Vibrio fluvialis PG41 TaxID=1336752 RepID=S7HVD1_VIBFL|nr:hypothetical protein L910_2855 [Vibrio fluvialis PG41]
MKSCKTTRFIANFYCRDSYYGSSYGSSNDNIELCFLLLLQIDY